MPGGRRRRDALGAGILAVGGEGVRGEGPQFRYGVAETLRMHGSSLEVHSTVGEGSSFGFRLRLVNPNGHAEARLRVTVTGGVAPLGSERGTAGTTVVVAH